MGGKAKEAGGQFSSVTLEVFCRLGWGLRGPWVPSSVGAWLPFQQESQFIRLRGDILSFCAPSLDKSLPYFLL